MASYGTGRPPTERDVLYALNGSPVFLGVLVSTGTAVNNATTATPFNYRATPTGTVPGNTLMGTLAGKMLLVQPTAAGLILPSTSASISVPGVTTIALRSVVPPAADTAPGYLIGADVGSVLLMASTMGWLQWLPVTGSANLMVYELV